MHLIPKAHIDHDRIRYVYSFEEPENNLHPGILRRLIRYIYDFCSQNESIVFITSHSNVVLDSVSKYSHSQIIQITHNGKTAKSRSISARFDHLDALYDLGAKPSDLMQSNCIIWVEGPSDRIYINKWIELYSNNQLIEGEHYQCAYFGGSLLSRYIADINSSKSDLAFANLISVNPRSLLIADSDRKRKRQHLKDRVKTIKTQMDSIGCYVWVTAAREIENYIPLKSLERIFNKSCIRGISKYERVMPHNSEKSYFSEVLSISYSDKVSLAQKVVEDLNIADISELHDLNLEMRKIVKKIKEYNHIT